MDTLNQIRQIRQTLPQPALENVNLREELLSETRKLLFDLERPDNVVERICFQLLETAVVYAAIKMGVFKILNNTEESSAESIAEACNADPVLVGRMLRCLSSHGNITENKENSYSSATTSYTFAEAKNEAAMEFCKQILIILQHNFDFLSHGWLQLPSYLEERKWRNSTSYTDTALAKAFNRPHGDSIFNILKDHRSLPAFNTYMAHFNDGHKDWVDFYPVMERLGDGADTDPSSVMMVDVGGGGGHQTLALKRKYPQLPGRFIVQDLPQGLPANRNSDEVEYMEHDFHLEQPIKGARLYYLRYISHDWPQGINIHIFTQLRKAMKPGYSRLIVHEWIVPTVQSSSFMTAQDFNMMVAQSGMERTLALHTEVLEKAGLKVTKIYSPGDNISESVIEAEVAA